MSTPLRTPSPPADQRSNPEVRLSVEQASYVYAPNPSQAPLFTLEALSFQAKPGEIVAILGPNASGKSTLLNLISGALEPLSGRVFLNGFATYSLPPQNPCAAHRARAAGKPPGLSIARVGIRLAGSSCLQPPPALRIRERHQHRQERACPGWCNASRRTLDGPNLWRRKTACDSRSCARSAAPTPAP